MAVAAPITRTTRAAHGPPLPGGNQAGSRITGSSSGESRRRCQVRHLRSLVPQRERRVHAGGPPRGQVAGEERHQREQQADAGEGERIGGPHFVQQAGDLLGGAPVQLGGPARAGCTPPRAT